MAGLGRCPQDQNAHSHCAHALRSMAVRGEKERRVYVRALTMQDYRRTAIHSRTCRHLGLREKFLCFARAVRIFTNRKTCPEIPSKPHKMVLEYLAAAHFSRLCGCLPVWRSLPMFRVLE